MRESTPRSRLLLASPGRRATLLAILLATPAATFAAPPGGMEALPSDPVLAQLIADSLAARPELKQAESTVSAERERIPQVGALPDPTLSLGIQNDGFKSIQIGKMETSYWQIMLSQPLPWPGKRRLREDVARLASTGAESNVVRARLSTEAEVRRAYLGLMVVRERLVLLDELERIWQRSLGTARARYESGEGAQSDVMRAQLEMLRIQQRRWAMKTEEASGLQALNRLRNHPLDEPIAPPAPVRDLPLPALPALDAAVADAEARSPELASARAAEQQGLAQVRLSERERFPDIGIQAGVMLRGSLEPMWTVGISVGLPIWSGRKQSRAVAESQARAQGSASSAEAVRQVLDQRVNERRSALASALETVRIFRQGLLVQSQATAESTLAQYRVGRVTFAAVLDANAGYLADREADLLASAEAQRIAIAAAEVSMDPVGGGTSGGMGGASVPGAGAASGGASAGAAAKGGAPTSAPAGGGASSSGM